MTTIAYRDGVMAGDSLVTQNGVIEGYVTKVRDIKGILCGSAGNLQDVVMFMRWIEDGMVEDKKPELSEYFEGIIVKDNEVIIFENKLIPIFMENKFYALGSGKHLAIGAMANGANAFNAVKIACEYDTCSGGDIVEVLREKK